MVGGLVGAALGTGVAYADHSLRFVDWIEYFWLWGEYWWSIVGAVIGAAIIYSLVLATQQ